MTGRSADMGRFYLTSTGQAMGVVAASTECAASASMGAATTVEATVPSTASSSSLSEDFMAWGTDVAAHNQLEWPGNTVGDPYRCSFDISAAGSNVTYGFNLRRVTPDLSTSLTGGGTQLSAYTYTGTGIKLGSNDGQDSFRSPASGSSSDRAVVCINAWSGNSMSGNTLTVNVGDADSWIENDVWSGGVHQENVWVTWGGTLPGTLRNQHRAVVDSSDRVWIMGGANSTPEALTRVDRYVPSTNTWDTPTTMPAGRYDHAIGIDSSDRIFIFGGNAWPVSSNSSTTYRYTISSNTWNTMTAMPRQRRGGVAVYDGTYFWLIGGDFLTVVDRYDPVNDTWSAGITNTPTTRSDEVIGYYYDGKIFYTAGNDNSVQVYDIATNSWSTTTSTPVTFFEGGAWASKKNLLYVANGYNATDDGRLYVFDALARTWTRLADPPAASALNRVTGAISGKHLWQFGGGDTPTDAIYRYTLTPGHIHSVADSVNPTDGRRNLVTNPSFEVDATGWTAVSASVTATRSTEQSYAGTASLKLTSLAASTACYAFSNGYTPPGTTKPASAAPVTSRNITLRYRVYSDVGRTYSAAVRRWSADGTYLGESLLGTQAVSGGAWGQVDRTDILSADTAFVVARVGAVMNNGETCWIDAVMLENAATNDGFYVDGSTPGASWDGTAHASASRMAVTAVLTKEPVLFSGSSSITSAGSGTVAITKFVSGSTLSTTATIAGSASVIRTVSGTRTVTATITGVGPGTIPVDGALTVTAPCVGAGLNTAPASGTRAATATLSGAGVVIKPVSGTTTVTAAPAGTPNATLSVMSGSRSVTASVDGVGEILILTQPSGTWILKHSVGVF